ncbi:gamma-glutamyltransferase [Leucobacter tardus]|uniref:Gamma-glutamyltransferase n=1 Tax=Leucobacter tardus TaxID=501483 RepID=A0A939QDC1_9MICO|nr:gamma-glutamyltransferase [Leucobacter tardus]MBO2989073.1 gamma-glutamyltransferase [Leucobacter tardus]
MTTDQRARGAISTSHHLATEAGAAVIEAGGNAVDAAITAAAALCVVYPNNVALGGDLVALVRSPDGAVHFLNATGRSPSGLTLAALRERHGDALPLRGIDTVTVPGGVRGWRALHDFGASRTWAEHLAPATAFAETGHPTARSVAAALVEEQASLAQDPGARAVFYPNGTPLAAGEQLMQPALAATLRTLAEQGSDAFYSGDLARAWISGLREIGSQITPEDAAAFEPEWAEALAGDFAGHRVLTGPPNTSGFMLLRALNAVAAGIEDPLGAGAGALAAAFHDANTVRAALLADPDVGPSGQTLVDADVPAGEHVADPKRSGDTVGLSTVTADGWAVSLINSVYCSFGAHILEPRTGVIFQNRGTSFSLDPSLPNAFAPNQRPRHTLMPVMVLRDGELAWVPSTMGGSAQPQIHTQLLLRSTDGAIPHDATHAPRWIVDEVGGDRRLTVTIEEDVPVVARDAIAAAGFTLNIVPRFSEDLGHSNLIRVRGQAFDAASDPRSDGSAIVVDA